MIGLALISPRRGEPEASREMHTVCLSKKHRIQLAKDQGLPAGELLIKTSTIGFAQVEVGRV